MMSYLTRLSHASSSALLALSAAVWFADPFGNPAAIVAKPRACVSAFWSPSGS